jgi:hypothetical protein
MEQLDNSLMVHARFLVPLVKTRDFGMTQPHGNASLRISQESANQFDEARRNAEEKSGKIKPVGMKPAVDQGPYKPPDHNRGGKCECQLGVAGGLHPEVASGTGFGIGTGRHAADSIP